MWRIKNWIVGKIWRFLDIDGLDKDFRMMWSRFRTDNESLNSRIDLIHKGELSIIAAKFKTMNDYMEQLDEKYMRLLTTVEKHVVQDHRKGCKCKKGKK